MIGVLCLFGCAIAFRIRGGLLASTSVQTPGQISRLIFALMAGLTSYHAGLTWQLSLIMIPLWWVSCMPGWSHSIDLGKNEDTFWRDFLVISCRGFLWPLLPAIFLTLWPFVGNHEAYPHAWAMPLFGLLLGPAYFTGSLVRINVWGLGTEDDYVPRGEFLAGYIYGVAILVTI